MMSTLHDGSLVRQELTKCWTIQGGNSGLPLYLVIYLGRDIMPLSSVTKFHKDLTKTIYLQSLYLFEQFKGYNPGVPWAFELVIERWLDMIHLGIVTKF